MIPNFSIIIPTYNRSLVLERAINSVKFLESLFIEIIVVDDGSNDNSKKIVNGYPCVNYFFQENSGVCSARNNGAKISKGEWLIFLDSDDELTHELLLLKKTLLNENYDVIKWGVNWIFPNGDLKKLIRDGKSYVPDLSGSFAIRREKFISIGGYDENLKFGENTELFHRIKLNKFRQAEFSFIGLIYYDSLNGGSKSLLNAIESNLFILEKHNETLSKHTKYLFHQVIGVNQIRLRSFSDAKHHLWKAFCIKPWKLRTLARFFISLWPMLAKRLYKEKVIFK